MVPDDARSEGKRLAEVLSLVDKQTNIDAGIADHKNHFIDLTTLHLLEKLLVQRQSLKKAKISVKSVIFKY